MCIICDLICRFCSCKCNCEVDPAAENFEIGDHPILHLSNDVFKVQERIVNKIYQDLSDIHGQITIAITGEWGVGKTSVMNLLQNKLLEADDKNIIIKFDPQIEGKFEISDLIGAFYLKLYQRIRNKKIKAFLIKSLQALAVLANVDIKGSIGIPGVLEVGASYNPKKKIDALIEVFEKTKPEEFSLQAEELNKLLKEEQVKLHVFIDEIDRLSEPYITNFLLFCRTLEVFDNLICVVGVDYDQVLNKLMYERAGSQLQTYQMRYSSAKNYVDKLFQIKYQVHHDTYTLYAYVVDQMKRIDYDNSDNALADVFTSDDYKKQEEFMGLITYLSTPRRIKKWLISLKLNYSLIKSSHTNKFTFMEFLAVTVKHPVVTDNLSKHTSMLTNHKGILYININNQFGGSFTKNDNDAILMASLGVIGLKNRDDTTNDSDRRAKLEKLMDALNVRLICDSQSAKYLFNFLSMPTYLILLFVQGILSDKHVSLFSDYFNGRIDVALTTLLGDDSIVNIAAKDLAEALYKGGVGPSDVPTPTVVNKLWTDKIDSDDVINFYEIIAKVALRKMPIENIIDECPLSLSEAYLNEILSVCGVTNKECKYNLAVSVKPEDDVIGKKFLMDTKFEGRLIKDFNSNDPALKSMLAKWLSKFENDFQSNNLDVFCQKSLISIFYRYVQWGVSVDDRDNRSKLAGYVIKFLQDKGIDEKDKVFLKKSLNHEIAKNSKGGFLGRGDVLHDLFNDRAQEILPLIT